MASILTALAIGIIVPIILVAIGAIIKKLSRGTPWQRGDFYLGLEVCLAAVSAGMLYFFDLAVQARGSKPPDSASFLRLGGFLTTSLLLLFLVAALHQDWERKPQDPRQPWILGVAANSIGLGLFAVFTVLVKGIA